MRSLPSETADYIGQLNDTQAFNEFIEERETLRTDDPKILLFDQVILSKRNRGRTSFFSKSSKTPASNPWKLRALTMTFRY